MNAIFEPQGLHFEIKLIISRSTKNPSLMVDIESLRGLAFTTRRSKIPGILPFDPTSGWEGFSTWFSAVEECLENEKKKGSLPEHYDTTHGIIVGIMKGYPDMAIYDACDAYAKDAIETLASTDIPYVGLYGGAEPNYDYYPVYAGAAEIVEHEKSWGKILEDFYNSDFHTHLMRDEQFIEARKKEKADDE